MNAQKMLQRLMKHDIHLAYFNGERYHCSNWDCYEDKCELREIARLRWSDETIQPVLRCPGCGRYYYGLRMLDTIPASEPPKAPIAPKEPTPKPDEADDIILPMLMTV